MFRFGAVYENNHFLSREWHEGKLLLELAELNPRVESWGQEDVFAAETPWKKYKVIQHDSARLTHLLRQALDALPEVKWGAKTRP